MSRDGVESHLKQVIVIRKDLNMRKGKMAAQAAHAAMMFLVKDASIGLNFDRSGFFGQPISPEQVAWLQGLFTKVVVSAASEAELLGLIEKAKAQGVVVHPVYDSGLTEFHGVQTLTCAAFGPDTADRLQPITGAQPLL